MCPKPAASQLTDFQNCSHCLPDCGVGGGGVGFALAARVYREGLKGGGGRGEGFDGVESEVRSFFQGGGAEGGVGGRDL